ncbi:hypothetical protein KFE25_001881 [Diacronema lutheri]|uniref:Homeobox domain-containing protein n=1 Tax=Diacronema lutheri TaxID=2081491 RepID=A0A8J5XQP9_DIALT|nr:hypothetical protein KFE25_001881 [Diacronema lutheri]
MFFNVLPSFRGRRTREKFLEWQLALLEACFKADRFPPADVRDQLAAELGIAERCVRVWFQNRRQRHRKAMEQPPAVADGHGGGGYDDAGSEDDDGHADEEASEPLKPRAQPPSACGGTDSDGSAAGAVPPVGAPAAGRAAAASASDGSSHHALVKLDPCAVVELAKQFRPASHVPGSNVASRRPYAHRLASPLRPVIGGFGEGYPVYPGYGVAPHDPYGQLAAVHGAPLVGAAQPRFIVSNGACYQLVAPMDGLFGGHPAAGAMMGALGLPSVSAMPSGYVMPQQPREPQPHPGVDAFAPPRQSPPPPAVGPYGGYTSAGTHDRMDGHFASVHMLPSLHAGDACLHAGAHGCASRWAAGSAPPVFPAGPGPMGGAGNGNAQLGGVQLSADSGGAANLLVYKAGAPAHGPHSTGEGRR